MDLSHAAESFRGLVLRHRGRTGLTQRELAARLAVDRTTVQDWETGTKYPTAERLQALVRALLEAGGLTAGRENTEAHELWAAAMRDAPRMRTPFDEEWFAPLLAVRTSPSARVPKLEPITARAEQLATLKAQSAEDWAEAPDTERFIGRAEELALLQSWLQEERCRLVAVLDFGGIGKTSLAARSAQLAARASTASTGAACAMCHRLTSG
jgi:transcriptional regulator with XRE-family HTH domain